MSDGGRSWEVLFHVAGRSPIESADTVGLWYRLVSSRARAVLRGFPTWVSRDRPGAAQAAAYRPSCQPEL